MTKATIEKKANAYMRLYNFLRDMVARATIGEKQEFRTKDKACGIYSALMVK